MRFPFFCVHRRGRGTYIEDGVVYVERKRGLYRLFLCYAVVFVLASIGIWGGSQAVSFIQEQMPVRRKYTVIIDPGHGGEDGGAISCTGRPESTYNLEIALRLEEVMRFLGYRTYMIRTTDTAIYQKGETLAQKKINDLKNRVQIVNKTEDAILLSIHQNYFPQEKFSGAQVFYAGNEESRQLAEVIQNSFLSTLNPGSHRKIKSGKGIYLLEKCEKTGVLIECGFLSNMQEEKKLSQPEYQKAIAAVIGTSVSRKLS